MRLVTSIATVILCATVASRALTQAPQSAAPALSPAQQIASAVLPLPADLREGATVLGYGADGKLSTLRSGQGTMVCLASAPKSPRFHVACYHESLEPFMARGRELRTRGITGDQVDTARFREAKEGRLKLPSSPAMLYSLTGDNTAYDAATNTIAKARSLFVVYIPYATSESTGLTAKPVVGAPWVMFPGTPKAHIMFVPSM